ncbi:MAG: response regulator [Saprospiraceae bacterium]|nr:response regulator [Saprospiraceae bacterium]
MVIWNLEDSMLSPVIILAEDDPVIALDLMVNLEHLKFQVVALDNPEELSAANSAYQPSLIILNYRYPKGPNGMELARNLLTQSSARILCVTGAGIAEVESARTPDSRLHILYKPFSRAQLQSCLQVCCNTMA